MTKSYNFNTSNFSREEFDAAIKSLKNNKAPFVDNFVNAELLKGACGEIRLVLDGDGVPSTRSMLSEEFSRASSTRTSR